MGFSMRWLVHRHGLVGTPAVCRNWLGIAVFVAAPFLFWTYALLIPARYAADQIDIVDLRFPRRLFHALGHRGWLWLLRVIVHLL
jgi:hypothetical protein